MPPFYRFNNVDLILAIQSAGVIKNISELIFIRFKISSQNQLVFDGFCQIKKFL